MQNFKDPVQVFLRMKPVLELSHSETVPTVQIIDQNLVSVDNKNYRFDYAAQSNCTLDEFFDKAFIPVVDDFCLQNSYIVFTYGQSGAGKTYTLYSNNKEKGLIVTTCESLIQDKNCQLLTCSFIEIFQENLYDLLNKGASIGEEIKTKGYVEESLRSVSDLETLLKKAQKRVGGGKGHTIFIIGIKGKPQKMLFVDLAAAEKNKSSFSSQDKLKETGLINKSISALSSVIKSMSQNLSFINYRDSKLTLFLKDWLQSSKIVLISLVIPSKKSFLDTINTMKFSQRMSKLKKIEPDLEEISTISYLHQQLESLQNSLEFYKTREQLLSKLEEDHQHCVKKETDLNGKIKDLEEEVQMLRKEILEYNKVDSGEWLLSSDSEDHESYIQISKEKSGLEVSLLNMKSKLDDNNKEMRDLKEKIDLSEREKETHTKIINQLNQEVLDLKAKVGKYQELCVLLGKLNSNLVSEMNFSVEISADCPDFSYMSSTDASKMEIYKFIEGKDAKVYELAETCKMTEENLQKLREKYFADTNAYKKQVAKLKKELEFTKTENIKDNEYAMKVLEDLRSEKNKLLSIIEGFADSTEKKKIAELKEMNSILLENLRLKGQQVSELQKKFQDFLKEKENCDELKEKLHRKSEKIQMFRNDFYKIQVQLNKIPQYRKKSETIGLVDCVIDALLLIHSRKGKSDYLGDI